MSEANKALCRRMIEEGWNKHNLALLDELYADCVYYNPTTGELKGEALKQLAASLLAAFPDIRFTIEDLVAEGDKVVTRWSCTSTHQGEFMGLAPTGKQLTPSALDIFRIVEGKVVEERVEFDTLRFFQQLGALPQATGANKALDRRVFEEGWNKHNLALLDELYPDCVWYRPDTGELKGEALKQFVASVYAAVPDIRFTIEDQVAEGDKLVTRWSCTGTHQGEFMGLAPTGKQVTTSGVTISRIVEGKFVEVRQETDALGLLQQLGAVPALAKAKDKAAA
ncbi:MAG: ester cyclase [Terriglobia bacterium]